MEIDIKQVITSFLFKKILLLEGLFFFLLLSLSNILNTMQFKNSSYPVKRLLKKQKIITVFFCFFFNKTNSNET